MEDSHAGAPLKQAPSALASSSLPAGLSQAPGTRPASGSTLSRSKSAPLQQQPRGAPRLIRKMSLLAGRTVSIGLGWTASSEQELLAHSAEDGAPDGDGDGAGEKRPTRILDLPDRCLLAIMAGTTQLDEWLRYKLVCKRWRKLADEALQTLQVRDSRPLGSEGFVDALHNFSHLRCLQVHVGVSGVVTDVLLSSLGLACPQLRSLHISYREGDEIGAYEGPPSNSCQPAFQEELGLSPTSVTGAGMDHLFRSCCGLQELTLAAISRGSSHPVAHFALPESVGDLRDLRALALHCRGCTGLPESFGNLSSLTELSLGCEFLAVLPDTFGQLEALTSLDLSSCHCLTCLPETVGELTNLTTLELRGCQSLETLPKSLGSLKSLTRLNCQDCRELFGLPNSIGQLESLTDLHLQGCWALVALPESIGRLGNLTALGVRDCDSLAVVPDTVTALTNLSPRDMSRLLGFSVPRLASPSGR